MPGEDIYSPLRPARIRRHDIRGVGYAVHEWGEPGQPLLLFLHGWGDSGGSFQFVVDCLERDWHVVAPDWRGFGQSRAEVTSYWFPDYLADLHELLAIYSPGQPARIVGHSMGANVAGLYAGVFPERVRAFVNVEGFGIRDSDPADAPSRYRSWIEKAADGPGFAKFPDREALAMHIAGQNPRMGQAEARFVAGLWARGDGNGIRLNADPLHKLPNPILYRRAEARACWQAVTADVLLVAGADSRILALLDLAHNDIHELLPFPGAESIVIDDCGHMLHFEAPQALAQAIGAFMLATV